MLAFLNTSVTSAILNMLSPTLNYEVGHICSIPVMKMEDKAVIDIANDNISISKDDWDSFETSWDFKKHPLI